MLTVIAGVPLNGVCAREVRASRLADGLRVAVLLGATVIIVPGNPAAVAAARLAVPTAIVVSVLETWRRDVAAACVRAGAHYAGERQSIDQVIGAATRLSRRRGLPAVRAA